MKDRTVAALTLTVLTACVHASAVDRAQSLSRQGKDDQAIALLEKDLEAHASDTGARRLLVRLLGVSGDLPGARRQADALQAQLGPDDPVPRIELGHALELAHRYDEALAEYDEAALVAPTSPIGPREGGLRCARWGEVESARPRLEEAVRRGASDVEIWHALGLVRLHLGDLAGAEVAYRAGALADPKSAESWLGLATVALSRGDWANVLAAYDHVMTIRPHFAPGELGRALALAKLGRKADAAQALDHAVELGAPPGPVAKQRAALDAAE